MTKLSTLGASGKGEGEYGEQVTSSRPIYVLMFCARHLPLPIVGLGVLMTSAVYYVFSARARHECRAYQRRIIDYTLGRVMQKPNVLRQITSFALCVTEKVEGWLGRIHYDDVTFHDDGVTSLKESLSKGKGALLICSHLGNTEVLRSIATIEHTGVDRKVSVTIIMDKAPTAAFNRALDNMNKDIKMEVIGVDNIDIDTITVLMDRIASGGMVVVAGDRTPQGGRHKFLAHSFLGQAASFPYGAFLISALLKADTYIFFALRKKDFMWRPKYDMFVHKSSVTFSLCSRYEREERINALCGEFARLLEQYCLKYPYQWYNFYDFWRIEEAGDMAGVKDNDGGRG